MENRRAIAGIEYLRAIMSVFVVFYHFEILDKSLIFDKVLYRDHSVGWRDLLYFHVLLLAVPVFILISNYLFALKKPGRDALVKNVKRVLILLSFWPVAYILWKQGYGGFKTFIPHSLPQGVELFFSCGFTVYYFFLSLLFANILVYFFTRLSTTANAALFAGSCLVVMALPWLAMETGIGGLSAYWNPLNFAVYPPAAVLLSRFYSAEKAGVPHQAGTVALLLAAGVLLAFGEWNWYPHSIHFSGQGHAMPMYTRGSMVFFSVLVLLVALHPKITANGVVRFMAERSLALYCLHPFFLGLADRTVEKAVPSFVVDPRWIAFFIVVAASYLGAAILRPYLQKEVLN